MEDVKEKIMEIDSEEGMTHFQEITYNYVQKFAKLSNRDAMKIQKFLERKYDIEETFAINIVNIDPKSVPELRVILEKSYTGKTLNEDQLRDLLAEIGDLKTT